MDELELLAMNFTGPTRRETLNGVEYLVRKLRLIVPGVLNGSKGRLFYPPEEVRKDPLAWNGMPLVVYHPFKDGRPVSARDPAVIAESGIGFVYAANAADGPLDAEGWFNVAAVAQFDRRLPQGVRLLPRLVSNEQIELSTGLFTDSFMVPGKAPDGREYDAIARNYRPDHVAILPDQRGACSIDDGCGVLNNSEVTMKEQLIQWLVTNCDCWKGDEKTLNTFDEAKLNQLKAATEKAKQHQAIIETVKTGFGLSEVTANSVQTALASVQKPAVLPPTPQPTAMSYDQWMQLAPPQVRMAVQNALQLQEQEKLTLVSKLTANTVDVATKAAAEVALKKLDLMDLRALAALQPTANATPMPGAPQFFWGNLGAPQNGVQPNAQPTFNKADVLPIPVMDYGK
jgi:hypothetical protein